MDFALGYLFHRFFFRLSDFFHHWYTDGTRAFAHAYVSFLERTDKFFGVRINWRYIFQPLYRDFTIIGRIMGLIFRSIRIVLGLVIYAAASILFLIAYLAWLALPFAILFLVWRDISFYKS